MVTNTAGRIFCQRCRAANSLSEELCGRCGTRLLLVVEPSSLRYEEETLAGGAYDTQLLERISALENKLAKVTLRLTEAFDLLTMHAHSATLDHTLLAALLRQLHEMGIVNYPQLNKYWQELSHEDASVMLEQQKREAVRARIVQSYTGHERDLFARLVKEGFTRLNEKKGASAGVRTLERAAALAPENVLLNEFLGEHFFRERKPALARDYLSRASVGEPESGYLRLLLGLACGDEGDVSSAKELLADAVRLSGSTFAAHYGLGRILAAEEDWKSALVEFKQALTARAYPEAYYVVALVCHHLGRDRTAMHYLSKAITLDDSYAEAFYLLGVVRMRVGDRELAGEAFDAARKLNKMEPRYRLAKRRMSRSNAVMPLLPLFDLTGRERRRLMTGGDERLAAALRDDALGHSASR